MTSVKDQTCGRSYSPHRRNPFVIRGLCLERPGPPREPARVAVLGARLAARSDPGQELPSAADGLNLGLERAKHEWVVCVHQDVYLPEGWDRRLARQLREAERRFGPIGVAGVYGVGEVIAPQSPGSALAAERVGWVVDRGRLLRDGPELPARVATLDELLLVVPRNTPLRFDPALGFHLYGADICLQAAERGLAVVALGALCHHNSRSVGLPEAFFPSAEVFARKWRHRLPVATPCVVIDRRGAGPPAGQRHGWAAIDRLRGRRRSAMKDGPAGSQTDGHGSENCWQEVLTAFGEDKQRC